MYKPMWEWIYEQRKLELREYLREKPLYPNLYSNLLFYKQEKKKAQRRRMTCSRSQSQPINPKSTKSYRSKTFIIKHIYDIVCIGDVKME